MQLAVLYEELTAARLRTIAGGGSMHRGTSIASHMFWLGILVIIGGCGGSDSKSIESAPTTPTPQQLGTPQISYTIYMSANSPWDLAFAPDGAMFYTETCRGLSVRRSNGTVQRLFGVSGFGYSLDAPDLRCEGQSGMLGVAVDPSFSSNRFVYVYMRSTISTPNTNRVVRLIVDNDYASVSGRVDILDDIAFKDSANAISGVGSHSGGRIRFSPTDGYLYITTGDNHNGTLPQDLSRLGGKVLRVDRYGAAAVGNNSPNGGDPRIFTYGHRNVQGLAFRPGTGQPFSCEHGPGHTDEVTPLIAGANSGWDPAPQPGVVNCPSNYCGYGSNRPDGALTRMTDLERFPSAMLPSWTNEGRSQGMGPCAFLSGVQWRSWEGRLLVGIMGAEHVELLQLDANGMTIAHEILAGIPAARVRSIVSGPDGALYIATDGNEIWRVTAT